MQRASFHEGGHPLRILRAAQAVFVQELPGTGYVQPVETAASTGVAIYIERRAHFAWLEVTYTSHRKTVKVEKELLVGNRNVAGDGRGRRAGCAPSSRFLPSRRSTTGQHRSHNRTHSSSPLHLLRMTFIGPLSNPSACMGFSIAGEFPKRDIRTRHNAYQKGITLPRASKG
jgi:hypothetical protein